MLNNQPSMSGISSMSHQKEEKRKMGSMTLETIMCHKTKLKQAAMPCQATHAMQSNPFEPTKFDKQENTKYQKDNLSK